MATYYLSPLEEKATYTISTNWLTKKDSWIMPKMLAAYEKNAAIAAVKMTANRMKKPGETKEEREAAKKALEAEVDKLWKEGFISKGGGKLEKRSTKFHDLVRDALGLKEGEDILIIEISSNDFKKINNFSLNPGNVSIEASSKTEGGEVTISFNKEQKGNLVIIEDPYIKLKIGHAE